jgi:hypothetical protein
LGLDYEVSINSNQIHILNNQGFEHIVKEIHGQQHTAESTVGFHNSKFESIFINFSAFSDRKNELPFNQKTDFYLTLLHEIIHLVSFHEYKGYYKNEKENYFEEFRTGYRLKSQNSSSYGEMRGLDEAVVEKLTTEIINKHKTEFAKLIGLRVSGEIKDSGIDSKFLRWMEILEIIILKISEIKKEDRVETWKRFKKGLFTGEMMHLREIENIFGKGSLRMLALMGSSDVHRAYNYEFSVINFFKTKTQEERDDIAEKLVKKNGTAMFGYIKRKSGFAQGGSIKNYYDKIEKN